jgi:hypothetical protein
MEKYTLQIAFQGEKRLLQFSNGTGKAIIVAELVNNLPAANGLAAGSRLRNDTREKNFQLKGQKKEVLISAISGTTIRSTTELERAIREVYKKHNNKEASVNWTTIQNGTEIPFEIKGEERVVVVHDIVNSSVVSTTLK